MHKRLFKCGNSMALTIDAFTRRSLGIDESTLLHVTTEGRRIVIQKSSCDRPAMVDPILASSTHYSQQLLDKLMMSLDGAGFTREEFKHLRHQNNSELFSFYGDVKAGHPLDAVTVSRLERLYAKIRGGLTRASAIAETVIELPNVEQPTMLRGTTETLGAPDKRSSQS